MSEQRQDDQIREPLHLRLRAEAAEWDEGEDIVPLLLEAAAVIEGIPDAVAQAAVIGAKYSTARDEADRAWVVLAWLAQNNPAALELCPYKATR